MDNITTIFMIVGVVFIVSEFIIPGAVVIFLGLSAIIVGLLRYLGIVDSLVHSITWWFIISLALIILLRGVAQRFVGGEKEKSNTDEDVDAIGEVVVVVENISSGSEGRVEFRGTTWGAISDMTILKGTRVKIIGRDNLSWIVNSEKE